MTATKAKGSDPIVQVGSPVLRQVAKPVAKKEFGGAKIKNLITRMKKVLAKEDFGVAIAAPQVGASVRLFVVSGRVFESPEKSSEQDANDTLRDMVFINPKLIRLSRKKKEMSEGCLSVRGKYGTVLRHQKATIEAQDEAGKHFTYHGSELLAHIFQHEVDHLNGIIYIDKAEKLTEDSEREELRAKFPAGKKQPAHS